MAGRRERSGKPPARRNGGGRPPRRRSLLRRLAHWAGVLGIWLAVAVAAVVAWFAYDLPDLDRLEQPERAPSLTLVSADGETIATVGDLYGEFVPLREVPDALIQAVLATEDRRFFNHFGVDVFGLARAMAANLRAGQIVQGGSTITQQLAKNVFLTPDRTIKRKVQELLLAFWLERRFSKEQILGLYLNRVYLGAGTYGIDAAARRYFDKEARDLTLAEAAMLAGLLKAPSRYAPTSNLAGARSRAAQVLDNMVDAGWLQPAAAAAAKARPAALARGRAPLRNARYFADWVINNVDDYVGRGQPDLVVVTTLDLRLQRLAEAAVERQLAAQGGRREVGQAALLALSPDGAVRAMVGGRDYRDSAFNRATQARRQPGSAFKLFVYLAGLESGLTPRSVMVDRPVAVGNWQPRNFDGNFDGEVTLSDAFARSLNTVAVQVSERAGRNRVIEAAHRLGITAELEPHPSIALGTGEVSLLELTGAYAAVANGGYGVLPHGIAEIRTPAGTVLYRRQGGGLGRVIDERTVGELNGMLAAVIDSGTGRAARLDRPAAGKTGTSQDFRDAWFLGYTRRLVAGVWVGNDDGEPMNRVTGSQLPAQIWKSFMAAAVAGQPAEPLVAPPAEGPLQSLWDRLVAEFGRATGAAQPSAGGAPSDATPGRGTAGGNRRTDPNPGRLDWPTN